MEAAVPNSERRTRRRWQALPGVRWRKPHSSHGHPERAGI